MAGGQDLRHEIGAALPLGGDGLAVRSRQVIVFREILPEPGGERLHADGVEVVGVHEIGAAVEPDRVERVVQVEQLIAIVADHSRYVGEHVRVGRLRAVRHAQKEHVCAE